MDDEQINLLYKLHREVYGYFKLLDEFKKQLKNFYILTDYDTSDIKGYIQINPLSNDVVKIEWIYGPGYGKLIMLNIEYHFKQKKYKKIILNCSIDPTEQKETVMRRINFYIKNKYRVYDIEFRKKYGPLLKMEKNLIN